MPHLPPLRSEQPLDRHLEKELEIYLENELEICLEKDHRLSDDRGVSREEGEGSGSHFGGSEGGIGSLLSEHGLVQLGRGLIQSRSPMSQPSTSRLGRQRRSLAPSLFSK